MTWLENIWEVMTWLENIWEKTSQKFDNLIRKHRKSYKTWLEKNISEVKWLANQKATFPLIITMITVL